MCHVDDGDALKSGVDKSLSFNHNLPFIGCVILRKSFTFADLRTTIVLGHKQ